jgi:hypothetical protein
MYKKYSDTIFGTATSICRLSDMASIPVDPNNSDYQEYLKWLDGYEYQVTGHMQQGWVKTSEGNTPEPADNVGPDYRAQRAAEYPSIGDQLDMIFHAGLMPTELAIKIQAVKAKYPKT